MASKFKGLFKDSKKSIKELTYNLMLLYVAVASLVACAVFVIRDIKSWIILVLLCMAIIAGSLYFLQKKYERIDLFSMIAVILINMLMVPLMYIFGGGLFSGMAMVFIGSYLLTFILLNDIYLIASAITITCWDILVITYTFYYPDYIKYHFAGVDIIIDMVICMLTGTIVIALIWFVYEGMYRKSHDRLVAAGQSIEKTGAVKSRFLANMSHELRTPMNAILGMSELLEKDDSKGYMAYEASLIRESAFSLLTTINNVLTYSKLDSGGESLVFNQFKFSQLISDVLYSVNMEIGKKDQVVLFVNIDPTIPDVLYGDDAKIRNIFSYILFAAVRQTDEGRITLEIKYDLNKSNNELTIRAKITDTGYGFSADEKDSIFSSYEIYDTRKDSQLRRFGLELTICRYLVEMMGGKIEFNSIYDVGNEVTFEIKLFCVERTPIVKTADINGAKILIYTTKQSRVATWTKQFDQFSIVPDFAKSFVALEVALKDKVYDAILISDYDYDKVKSLISAYSVEEKTYIVIDVAHSYGDYGKCRVIRRPVHSLNISSILNGTWSEKDYSKAETSESFVAPDANVLIVDDNIVNVKVAQSILTQYEIKTYISTSGRDALEKLQYTHFDLVLLDQMMPEMDGVETLRQIRNLADVDIRRVPVVALTANIGEDVKEELLKAGFQDYLAKPIKIRYLEEVLKAYLPENMILPKKSEEISQKATAAETVGVSESKVEGKTESVAKVETATAAVSAEEFPPGLTVERGLMQMGGDQSTYNLILNTYFKDCGEKLHTIPKMFEDGDIKLYSITVHAVKGSSASIGALEVSELFRQLEMASKGGDLEFCQANMPHALNRLEDILQTIKEYLSERGEFKDPNEPVVFEDDLSPESDSESEEITNSNASESADESASDFDVSVLVKLCAEIDRINFDECDRIMDELVGSDFGEDINANIIKIKNAYDDFDYALVKEIVKGMQ